MYTTPWGYNPEFIDPNPVIAARIKEPKPTHHSIIRHRMDASDGEASHFNDHTLAEDLRWMRGFGRNLVEIVRSAWQNKVNQHAGYEAVSPEVEIVPVQE